MPREHRKRGKKHKKKPEDEPHFQESLNPTHAAPEPEVGEPSWIRHAPENSPEINIEAPFGYVDADVKAYFRTVDEQIRGWQEADESRGITEETTDPNEGTLC
jgi:nucleolar protein 9